MGPSQTATTIRLALRESDRRRHVRVPTLYHLVMQAEDRKRIVSIEDISLGGAAVFSVDPPVPGVPVLLAFPRPATKSSALVSISGRIVRQASGGVVGILFDSGQERAVKSVLKLLPALRAAPQKKARPSKTKRASKRR